MRCSPGATAVRRASWPAKGVVTGGAFGRRGGRGATAAPPRLALEEDRLTITPIYPLQRMPDFEEGAVGAGAVEHGGDHVAIRLRRGGEGVERAGHLVRVARGAQGAEPAALQAVGLLADLEYLDRGFALLEERVDADDGAPPLLDVGDEPHRG